MTAEQTLESAGAGTGALDALLTDSAGSSVRQFLPGKPGLVLLAKLAGRWGVDSTKGCRVWFEVDRSSRRAGRFDRD